MVNITVTMVTDPWRDLAFSYVPHGSRRAIEALFALDAALGGVLRTTREPLVGQMRLAWWREALDRLDAGAPPAEPVLQALAGEVLPRGIGGGELRGMVDGWEPLLGGLGSDAIADHARLRGRLLFEIAARTIGAAAGDPVADAGEGWALADLSGNLSDAGAGTLARERAATALAGVRGARWSRNGRPLGALSLIAQRRLNGPIPPMFVVRLARFRLTGR
jgi:phytoene synthase